MNMSSELPENLEDWPEEWLERYEERLVIMRNEGDLNRSEAAELALEFTRTAFRLGSRYHLP